MSLLSSASRQAKRVEQAHFFMPERLSGEPGNRALWLAWLVGLPLCMMLGAAANYGWHWMHNDVVIQKIDVPHTTELPFKPSEQNYDFVTAPLPEEMESGTSADVTGSETDQTASNQATAEQASVDIDTKSTLEKRFMQAVKATGQADAQASATPAIPTSDATPLGALPPRISQQVPALKYGAHVYSSVPANRTININGHDFHEGDEVARGVVLLRIEANASIFRVGAQSFSLNALTDWQGY
jgi:general secretion pathway protein B